MPDRQRGGPRVVPGIDALGRSDGRLFVVVGVFDGLHLGHLYLLGHLRSEAEAHSARATVITFDHHPDEILTGAAPPLLCDPQERLDRLSAAGVDVTIVQHFDLALRMTSYEAFIRRIADRVDLAGFLMTPDSAFGHERRGTTTAVAELGAKLGFEVVVVPNLDLHGRPVRSAEIRTDIAAGDLAGAAQLLGRPYAVVGMPLPPAGRPVQLGFPMPVALPPAGDYPALLLQAPEATGHEAVVRVETDGTVSLPVGLVQAGTAVRVTFAGIEGEKRAG